jgi:hypothetical protein
MDTFIRDVKVMFGIDKVFRAKKEFAPLYRPGSCGMDDRTFRTGYSRRVKMYFPVKVR